jgi:hypothetical protein
LIPVVSKIKKKLAKEFGDKVHVRYENGCLYLSGELSDWDDIVRAGLM